MLRHLRESSDFQIYTPGSNAGLPISIMKSFEAPPQEIRSDDELLQERINTTVTSLLALLGIEADPIKSREHILLSNILAETWRRGENSDIGRLIQLIQTPPFKQIGVLGIESFYPSKERFGLAMQLNNLLAPTGFQPLASRRSIDINGLFHSSNGKPRVSIFYIAHLDDAQRMFFVSLLLNQIVGWMRAQSGTTSLRAILYIDEVFGYLPPVSNPPSKLPLMTLLKQARAFGLGVMLATQNPVDLDYKALSNAGTWFLGRLQTQRDKERVLDGLEGAAVAGQKQFNRQTFDQTLSGLGNRIFLMNDVHEDAPVVFETRWAMSYLRGPLTREQIKVLADPTKKQKTTTTLTFPATSSSLLTPFASSTKATQKPVISPDIPEYFVPIKQNIKQIDNLVYTPMISGFAQVRFYDPKKNIDVTSEQVFLTPISDNPLPVNWDDSEKAEIKISDLQKTPAKELPFTDLPSAALVRKNYAEWEKDFSDWLFRTQKLQLLRSSSLNQISLLGELERDFRVRLQQSAREKRDEQVTRLREKYSSAFARLDEKIRRAQMTLDQQKTQASGQKYRVVASIGEAILGSFLGRKSITRSITNYTGNNSQHKRIKGQRKRRNKLKNSAAREIKTGSAVSV